MNSDRRAFWDGFIAGVLPMGFAFVLLVIGGHWEPSLMAAVGLWLLLKLPHN